MPADSLDQIVSLCKRRGFVFPGSEIYGGLANSWDYGPLGVELKKAIQDWWWERFVTKRQDMVGIDAAIMMNPKVWEASGHVECFNDALIDCKHCRARHRADHLIEEKDEKAQVEGKSPAELTKLIAEMEIACPKCGTKGEFTDARTFNLLFQTHLGVIEGEDERPIHLRGEIAQAMFVNFKNVLNTTRKRLPFGIASVGKAFRNEITPGNFTYRTLEFDLMELEYFVKEAEWETHFDAWLREEQDWLKDLGFNKKNLRVREHTAEEMSHYSKRTVDIEYKTPFGWKEMFGLAYRTDFDLKSHTKHSGEELVYTDPDTEEKTVPHVIEPTFGLSRLTLMILLEAYTEESLGSGSSGSPQAARDDNDSRVVLKLHPRIAPVQVAILPLSKKDPLINKAQSVYDELNEHTNLRLDFDVTGSIGKRYRRQDEVGTPLCITIDFGTIGEDAEQGDKDTITLRDRDSLEQKRIKIADLREEITNWWKNH